MNFIKDNQLGVLGLCLMMGLVISSFILSNTFLQVKRYPNEVVSVTGAASKPITSDMASWRCRFARRANTMAAAYNALKGDTKVVTAYLKSVGISETEIAITQTQTQTLYHRNEKGYSTDQVSGYKLSQDIIVKSKDVDKIQRVSRSSTDLISRGIGFTSDAPEFFYTKLDDLKVEMLGEATKNAYSRAKSMAKSTQRDIGQLRTAQMGVFQITSEHSTDVSDYGINDTSSKEKKVTAVVNATFEMKH